MLFTSVSFLFFLPIIAFLFFVIPHKFRWLLLLSASFIFYAAFIPVYLVVLIFIIILDYVAALAIERIKGFSKVVVLWCAVVANLSVLVLFKYLGFLTEMVNSLVGIVGWNYSVTLLTLILPLGISFYIFQGLSYLVEVYRGKQRAENHLGYVALYISYFPQLVAGPIERPQHLLEQLKREQYFNEARVVSGLRLMLWGFFQKLVIADRLALFVDHIYSTPANFSAFFVILATVLFAIQIYCDFSGYSDIAIGASRILGIELMQNFRRPYFARSIPEFWSRWHISLSTWFRDYVYIPLGGNRVSSFVWMRNILITFLLSGLWHGADWTFVVWGLFHGVLFVLYRYFGRNERLTKSNSLSLNEILSVVMTFSLVCVGWIFFRADSIHDAWIVIVQAFSSWHFQAWPVIEGFYSVDVAIGATGILILLMVHLLQARGGLSGKFKAMPVSVRWASYYTICLAIYIFGNASAKQFIYFQF